MGLVSLVVEYNSIVVVGMDTFCCKGHEAIQKLLTAHIERLRARPELKDAWFIFLPEANLGHEADHMEYMLRNYRKIWTIRDKQRTGVVTTNTRKVSLLVCSPKTLHSLTHFSFRNCTRWRQLNI